MRFSQRSGSSPQRYLPETMGGGVALFDYLQDGDLDLLLVDGGRLSAGGVEPGRRALYCNDTVTFVDVSERAGIRLDAYGMGAVAGDVDGDGDLDLALANGHVRDNVAALHPGSSFAQPNQLLLNDGSGRFSEQPDAALARPAVSRGLAAGDLDLDGDVDVDLVIASLDAPAQVLENRLAPTGRLVVVEARDSGGSAIGAHVDLRAGGVRQRRELRTGCSYLSQSALAAHFGLALEAPVDIEVRWNDGRRQRLVAVAPGRRLLVVR